MPAIPSVTTLDEYFALPEDKTRRHELLDGVYIVSPPPSFRHQRAVMALYHQLAAAIGDRPDLILFPVLGAVVLLDTQWRDMARPLLVVEILSPSTARRDRLVKRRLYQEAGVGEYWIVDLDARLIERWRPEDERPEVLSDTLSWRTSESSPPAELDLTGFFAEVRV